MLITSKTVRSASRHASATHDGLIPLGGPIPRGDYLNFRVINHGKHIVESAALGKKTLPIKPGSIGHFTVVALRRGSFPYTAATVGGKTVRGALLVS